MLGTLCLSTKEPITTKHRFSGSICAGFGVPLLLDRYKQQHPATPRDSQGPEGRGESPLWLAQASKLAPAHALCGTLLATILHLRSHRRATMSTGVSPR